MHPGLSHVFLYVLELSLSTSIEIDPGCRGENWILFLLWLLRLDRNRSGCGGVGKTEKISRRRGRILDGGSYGGREDEVVEVHSIE